MKNKIEIQCKKDNIDFWEYYGVFVEYYLKGYFKYLKISSKLPELYNSDSEVSDYLLKNYLQNDYIFGKDYNLKKYRELTVSYKNKVFKWLDKTSDPYLYLFNPVYFYNTYNTKYGLYRTDVVGIFSEGVVDIAFEYARYQLKK